MAIAATLLTFIKARTHPLPAIVLGGLTAFAMAGIDIYYHATGVISWVYLLDAAAELVFGFAWLLLLTRQKQIA